MSAEGGGGHRNGGSAVDHELKLSARSSLMHRQKSISQGLHNHWESSCV